MFISHKNHLMLILSVFSLITTLLTAYMTSVPKQQADIDTLDVLGEGSIALVVVAWIVFVLISRPAGTVSNKLLIGLNLLLITALLDFADEFVHYKDGSAWLTTIESLPALFGMLLMTRALYALHQEQQVISRQLFKQERFYREHQHTDYITGLYSAQYIRKQVSQELRLQPAAMPFSLLMVDICRFNQFNQQYGEVIGNSLLADVAKLLMMNVRSSDLVCRYASDCFIILLPNTKESIAFEIAQHIDKSLANLAFKPTLHTSPVYPKIAWSAVQYTKQRSAQEMINSLADNLRLQKKTRSVA